MKKTSMPSATISAADREEFKAAIHESGLAVNIFVRAFNGGHIAQNLYARIGSIDEKTAYTLLGTGGSYGE